MALVSSGQGITESPLLTALPPDSFFRLLVQLNHLEPVSRFLFLPGMLFNDCQQWWGTTNRKHPHEGVDICQMQDIGTGIKNILPQMLIPAILPGHPVHFHRDFLGETLYIRHPERRRENGVLHTLYGHGQFNTDLSKPAFINRGDILGTISLPPRTSPVPGHLHISCAWIHEDQEMTELNWQKMMSSDRITFIDPLPFLFC